MPSKPLQPYGKLPKKNGGLKNSPAKANMGRTHPSGRSGARVFIHGLKFTLQPVMLSEKYEEVEVAFRYLYDTNWVDFIAEDPRDPQFEKIRPQFEMILERFYDQLQKRSA